MRTVSLSISTRIKTVPESGHPESRESNAKIASAGPGSREGVLLVATEGHSEPGAQREQLLVFHELDDSIAVAPH